MCPSQLFALSTTTMSWTDAPSISYLANPWVLTRYPPYGNGVSSARTCWTARREHGHTRGVSWNFKRCFISARYHEFLRMAWYLSDCPACAFAESVSSDVYPGLDSQYCQLVDILWTRLLFRLVVSILCAPIMSGYIPHEIFDCYLVGFCRFTKHELEVDCTFDICPINHLRYRPISPQRLWYQKQDKLCCESHQHTSSRQLFLGLILFSHQDSGLCLGSI